MTILRAELPLLMLSYWNRNRIIINAPFAGVSGFSNDQLKNWKKSGVSYWPNWITPVSRMLEINESTIRRWLTGKYARQSQ